jgi:hypothetical protein
MALLKTKKTDDKRFDTKKMKELRSLTLMLDANLVRRFKAKAIMKGDTMTEVLTKAMVDYLA